MLVDDRAEVRIFLGAVRPACSTSADTVEAGTTGLVDPEELLHVEIALGGDLDLVDGEAERLRVQAENDDLARDERTERS